MNEDVETLAMPSTSTSLPTPIWTQSDVDHLFPDRFEQQVRQFADRVAVKSNGTELTYDALNRAANRLAHAIRTVQGDDERPVALLFEHSAAMIVALLGVLKAGRIYVPLATTDPQIRITDILVDAGATLLVTNHKNLALAQAVVPTTVTMLNLEELDQGLSDENTDRSGVQVHDAVMNIVYTSGSTGVPKGTMQLQRNMLHEARCITAVTHITHEDRYAMLSSYTINAATSIMGHALLNGATLLPFDVKREGVPALAAWLKRERITLYHSVTTVFRHLMATLEPDEVFTSMRSIQLGGEPVFTRDVILFRQHFPRECVFRVGLGSTEAGLATCHIIGPDEELNETALPLGKASLGRQILILDEDGAPAPDGEIGEIAIKSRYLALGYWNKPEQTAAVFRPVPGGGDERIYLTGDLGRLGPDGELEHVGRKDLQVKIRGNRVDLHVIETRLLHVDGVREAAVVARKDQRGENRLVAYIVPSAEPVPTPSILRQALGTMLPEYMIPAAFVPMQQLPQVTFGKIDRLALPTPDWEAVAAESVYVAPRTPVEEVLAQLWSEILGVQRVSIHAHFFDLGGDSLRAGQIVGRLGSLYPLDLPVTTLFEAPTVAELALVITQRLAESSEDDAIAQLLNELEGSGEGDVQERLASGRV